jgi:hypothetical protein
MLVRGFVVLALSLPVLVAPAPAAANAEASRLCAALLHRLTAEQHRLTARRYEASKLEQRCALAKREGLPHLERAWRTVLTSKVCAHHAAALAPQAAAKIEGSRANIARVCDAPRTQQADTRPVIRGRD